MHEDVPGSQPEEVDQECEDTLLLRQATTQNTPRQHQDKNSRGKAKPHEAEEERYSSVDLVVGARLVRVAEVVEKIAGLDGIEEERPVVVDGRNVVLVARPEFPRVGTCQQFVEGVRRASPGKIQGIEARFGGEVPRLLDV